MTVLTPADWPRDEYLLDPFPYWKFCRDEFPVWWNPSINMWQITPYDEVVAVFADSQTWSNRYYATTTGVVFGPTMLQMDGREHVVRRTIVAPEVVGRRLDGYRELIRRNATALIDRFVDRGRADLVADFSTWLPVNVIVDMLGLPNKDLPLLHDWYQAMMAGLVHPDPEQRAKGIAANESLRDYVAPIVQERIAEPGNDFISKIVHAECDGERLTADEVQAFISLMLTAGGETTDKAIGNMWTQLLGDPAQIDAVRRDPLRFDDAFGETMRHSFPVHAQTRTANRDLEIRGTLIREGDVVTISIGSANNDETAFSDPRRFDLDRADLWRTKELRKGYDHDGVHGHLGFGLGKHFCLGYEMARAEAVIASELLLEACPDIRMAEGFTPTYRLVGSTWSAPELQIEF